MHKKVQLIMQMSKKSFLISTNAKEKFIRLGKWPKTVHSTRQMSENSSIDHVQKNFVEPANSTQQMLENSLFNPNV